jgi:hypothetical protein
MKTKLWKVTFVTPATMFNSEYLVRAENSERAIEHVKCYWESYFNYIWDRVGRFYTSVVEDDVGNVTKL